jgi:hypothetical protein
LRAFLPDATPLAIRSIGPTAPEDEVKTGDRDLSDLLIRLATDLNLVALNPHFLPGASDALVQHPRQRQLRLVEE